MEKMKKKSKNSTTGAELTIILQTRQWRVPIMAKDEKQDGKSRRTKKQK